ncbi:putative secreted protein (Por secretion system target) [Arcicella aurantiaca]|uniref:Putative secreted protein (Por secretion system target) n=1 Tax=Arcicella aurantiaca TaxID=591202 RepID=A0A316EK64_9BACT|nr:two-component regulator propeller domain-containing protein [Arcicella aurantiaca]PWK23350.1 putative secreted protein (Por secretion system target) [Arcicella aurantiaca]
MKKILLFFKLFLCVICLINTSASAQKWTPFYSNLSTNAFIEYSDGTVWVATEGGVVSYNTKGDVLASYSTKDGLPSNLVTCIAEDKEKNIWVGTPNGIAKFNGKIWTVFNNSTSAEIRNGIKSILCDKTGVMWFGYADGIFNYDGKNWKSSLVVPPNGLDHTVFKMIQDKNGNIWAGIRWEYSYKYDGKTWVKFGEKDIPNANVNAIYEDKNGKIWFGTLGGGVVNYDGKTWTKYNEESKTLPYNYVNAILEDKTGNMWFGQVDKGYTKFDGKTWVSFNVAQKNIVNNSVNDIIQTTDGTLWFSTRGGISKLSNTEWTPIATQIASLPSNYVFSTSINNLGNLVLGTANGVSIYDGSKWSWINSSNSQLANNEVRSVYQDKDGNYWYGTYAGVNKFDGKTWTLYNKSNSKIVGDIITTIIQDKQGAMWFGTTNGLSKFDGKDWVTFDTQSGSLPDNNVKNLIQDKDGNIWVATPGGLAKYDAKIWTVYNNKSGAPASTFKGLIQDQSGNIWVGTSSLGVFKFDGKTWTNFAYNSSTGKGELTSNEVTSIFQDKSQNIWVATYNGVSKFDGSQWIKYSSNNTPTTIESSTSTLSISEDSKNNIWFGTDKGLHQFFIECTSKTPTINGQPKTQKINENQAVTFHVTVIDVTSYQWQLSKDNGNSWQDIVESDNVYTGQITDKLTIVSAKISQNDYQFRCKLINGCASNISNVGTLSVLCTSSIPTITSQPINQKIKENLSASFQTLATDVSAYQWQISIDKGLTWQNIKESDVLYSGQITNKLTIISSKLTQNDYQYRCVLVNGCASTATNVGVLNVICALDSPIITKSPVKQSISEGQTTTFELAANGASNYEWFLSLDKGVSWRSIILSDTIYTGIFTNKLVIKNTPLTFNGLYYRCKVANSCYTIYSDVVSLDVSCNRKASEFTVQATNQSIFENQKATFEVTTLNAVQYTWMLSSNQGTSWQYIDTKDTLFDGQITNKLTIKSAKRLQNNYMFRCVISNGCSIFGVVSNTYSLEVKCGPQPVISKQPESQIIFEKQSALFQLTASDAKAYQWQQSIDKGNTWGNILSNDDTFNGQLSNSLTLKSAKTTQNDYRFRCQLVNGCSSIVTNIISLTVNVILSVDNNKEHSFIVYPNPTSETISFELEKEKFKVLIIDMKGNVLKEVLNQKKIIVSDLREGMYIINVESNDEIQSYKITIKR